MSLPGDQLGFIFAVIISLSVISLLPIFLALILLQSGQNSSRISTLTERFYTQRKASSLWTVFILLRWLLTIFILLLLSEFPSIQILMLIFMSLIYQMLVLHIKPYKLPSDNKIQFSNEFLVSLYLYLYIPLTDFQQSDMIRDICAWGLIGVILVCIIINLGNLLMIAGKSIYLKVKSKIRTMKFPTLTLQKPAP
jgi:uncharacterized membrane protein YjfL (UPF0719 family)